MKREMLPLGIFSLLLNHFLFVLDVRSMQHIFLQSFLYCVPEIHFSIGIKSFFK